jgi:Stage II sporulation protein E (SpoIIE)/Phosphoserine phosphatase RsbU, N-terminal domain
VTEARTIGAPDLAARYSAAFRAYLADRGEGGLGAAYGLGREAVAAQLSVLDLAEAHHAALGAALEDGTLPPETTIQAGADFLRESLSIFESVHRGYSEVREVARLEHEHVEQLRALADVSVALNSSLGVEEILRLAADAAHTLLGAGRSTLAVFGPDPRLAPVTATAPPHPPEDGPSPKRRTARLTARGQDIGLLEVVDSSTREFTPRDDTILTQLAAVASVALSNAQLYVRERTIAKTLQRSLRPGALPDMPGIAAAVRFHPAGEGVELGGDFYDLYQAGGGAWAALIGDVQGKGPDAAAVTALARHTLRAAAVYEGRPSGVLAQLHRALREQRTDGRFCTVAHAHARAVAGRVLIELACGGHPLPLVVHRDGTVEPVGRLGTLLGTDIVPELYDVSVDLEPGDVLVMYTDGVTEVRRRRREVFGYAELIALLASCGGLPPDDVVTRVEDAVLAASQGDLRDDMAILALGPILSARATEESDG